MKIAREKKRSEIKKKGKENIIKLEWKSQREMKNRKIKLSRKKGKTELKN